MFGSEKGDKKQDDRTDGGRTGEIEKNGWTERWVEGCLQTILASSDGLEPNEKVMS